MESDGWIGRNSGNGERERGGDSGKVIEREREGGEIDDTRVKNAKVKKNHHIKTI